MRIFLSWLKDTQGATAIEYGMIVVAVALAISTVVFTMGDGLESIFEKASTKITDELG